MRLFLKMVLIWTAASFVLGFVGRTWLREIGKSQQEMAFRRVARAVVAMVESNAWQQPAESDPEWQALEKEFAVGMIPISATVAKPLPLGTSSESPQADGRTAEVRSGSHSGEPESAGAVLPVKWSRMGIGDYRISLDAPLYTPEITATELRITAQVEDSAVGRVWWSAWGLLSAVTYVLGWIGWWTIRRESRSKRRLLQPWFRALDARAEVGALLPRVEPQDSDFCLQMDSVATSVNRIYSELKASNDRAELVLGNLQEGVLAVDDRFRVLLANRAFRRLLDLPEENYLLRPLLEVIRTPVIARLAERMVREQVPAEEQAEVGTGPKHLRILARPLPFGNQRMGALITVRDETMIKRVDLIKRDFVANASHELKTPLAAIRAYAETLQLGALDDREMAENFVTNIITQADRMDGLVQGMLQLSRVEVGSALKFRNFDVVDAVEACISAAEAVARGKGVRIEVNLPSGPLTIRSDRDGFQTIASNLLSNGVRYTDSDGTVTVKLSESPLGVVLEVADTGIGMSEEDLERVFERFYRAEKDRSVATGGTGLGLSIVKHLTQALGGSVQATSQLGIGSSFVVEIPKTPVVEAVEPGGARARRAPDADAIQPT